MLICLIGRVGSGKNTIAKFIEEDYGFTRIRPHTTSARHSDSDDYIYSDKITLEKHILERRVFEWDRILGDYYWTLYSDYEGRSNICIVTTPKCAEQLKWEFSDTYIIYIDASLDRRLERLVNADTFDKIKYDEKVFNAFACDYVINGNENIVAVVGYVHKILMDIRKKEERRNCIDNLLY